MPLDASGNFIPDLQAESAAAAKGPAEGSACTTTDGKPGIITGGVCVAIAVPEPPPTPEPPPVDTTTPPATQPPAPPQLAPVPKDANWWDPNNPDISNPALPEKFNNPYGNEMPIYDAFGIPYSYAGGMTFGEPQNGMNAPGTVDKSWFNHNVPLGIWTPDNEIFKASNPEEFAQMVQYAEQNKKYLSQGGTVNDKGQMMPNTGLPEIKTFDQLQSYVENQKSWDTPAKQDVDYWQMMQNHIDANLNDIIKYRAYTGKPVLDADGDPITDASQLQWFKVKDPDGYALIMADISATKVTGTENLRGAGAAYAERVQRGANTQGHTAEEIAANLDAADQAWTEEINARVKKSGVQITGKAEDGTPVYSTQGGWQKQSFNGKEILGDYITPDGQKLTAWDLISKPDLQKKYTTQFPKAQLKTAAEWANQNPQEFINTVKEVGDTPETRLLLREIYPDQPQSTYDMFFDNYGPRSQNVFKIKHLANGEATPDYQARLDSLFNMQAAKSKSQPISWSDYHTNFIEPIRSRLGPKDKNDVAGKIMNVAMMDNPISRQMQAGVGEMAAGTQGVLHWMGQDGAANSMKDWVAMGKSQELRAMTPDEMADWKYAWTPQWWNQVGLNAMKMIPMAATATLATMLGVYTAGAAAGAASLGAVATMIAEAFGASFFPTLGNAALQSGGIFDAAKAKGWSTDQANKAAWTFFGMSAPEQLLNPVNLAMSKIPGGTSSKALIKNAVTGGKIGAVGLTGAGEMAYQDWLTKFALNEPYQFTPDTLQMMIVAGGMGAGMSGGIEMFRSIQNKAIAKMPAAVQEEIKANTEKATSAGVPPDTAKTQAMDAAAGKYSEVADAIRQAADEAKQEWAAKEFEASQSRLNFEGDQKSPAAEKPAAAMPEKAGPNAETTNPSHYQTTNGESAKAKPAGSMPDNIFPFQFNGKTYSKDQLYKLMQDHPELIPDIQDELLNSQKKGSTAPTENTKPVAAPLGNKVYGKESTAYDANAKNEYKFKYAVVDEKDLVASHDNGFVENPNYPQELQPRQRDRAASQVQVGTMAQNLKPEALTSESNSLSTGAPIIGRDNVVESGNGRVLALRRAKADFPENYKKYVDSLKAQAEKLGIDPSKIDGIENPVLVRERITDVDRAKFAQEANVSSATAMSPFETAVKDAGNISPEVTKLFQIGENQSVEQAIRSTSNKEVVAHILKQIPENELPQYMAADGTASPQLIQRVKLALLAKVFKGEGGKSLVEAFAESADSDIKRIETGIYQTLGALTKIESKMAAGEIDPALSFTEDFAKAANKLAALRSQGMAVKDYMAQGKMFGDDLTPVQNKILEHLDTISKSGKKVGEFLADMTNQVEKTPAPGQTSMLEMAKPTEEQVVNKAIENQSRIEAKKATLFDAFDEAVKSHQNTLGAGPAITKEDLKFYKALVDLAGEYMLQGAKNAAEFAKRAGIRILNPAVQHAWDEASGKVKPSTALPKNLGRYLKDVMMAPDISKYTPEEQAAIGRLNDTGARFNETWKNTNEERKVELQGKMARVYKALKDNEGEDAIRLAKDALRGTLTDIKLNPDELFINQQDANLIMHMLKESKLLTAPERMNAMEAISELFKTGKVPRPHEQKYLSKVFGDSLDNLMQASKTLRESGYIKALNALGLLKSAWASFDLSYTARQGAILAAGHPKQAFKALGAELASLVSEKAYNKVALDIAGHPRFEQAKGAGVRDTIGATSLLTREEAFMSDLGMKIPVMKNFNRAGLAFINKLRFDTFNATMDSWENAGMNVTKETQHQLATFINEATGAAKLPFNGEFAATVNALLFSPQYVWSRFSVFKALGANPLVRKEFAKSMAAFIGINAGIGTLAVLSGMGKTDIDPRSSEGWKIKIGQSVIDPWAGEFQVVRMFAQLLTGTTKNPETGNITSVPPLDVIQRFARGKVSPLLDLALTFLTGKTYEGKSFDPFNITGSEAKPQDIAGETLIPGAIQDFVDAMQKEGLTGIIPGMASVMGLGVMTYEPLGRVSTAFYNERKYLEEQETKLNNMVERKDTKGATKFIKENPTLHLTLDTDTGKYHSAEATQIRSLASGQIKKLEDQITDVRYSNTTEDKKNQQIAALEKQQALLMKQTLDTVKRAQRKPLTLQDVNLK